MADLHNLKEIELDALREVSNIGAGHAATALSQMTSQRIMITVPRVNVTPLEEAVGLLTDPNETVAAVLLHMLGDLTGRTLVLFPEESSHLLCDHLLRRDLGSTGQLGVLEESSLKEAGNILSGAYLNALSDFMGMMLLPSVPSLAVDMASAVLTSTFLNFGHDRDYVFCVETELCFDTERTLRGHFLLLPDMASLQAIFDAVRVT